MTEIAAKTNKEIGCVCVAVDRTKGKTLLIAANLTLRGMKDAGLHVFASAIKEVDEEDRQAAINAMSLELSLLGSRMSEDIETLKRTLEEE